MKFSNDLSPDEATGAFVLFVLAIMAGLFMLLVASFVMVLD